MKKRYLLLLVLIVAGVLVYSQRATIASAIMARGAEAALAADTVATLPDGLHVVLCGAGGPLPAANRSGPCVGVVAGEQFFVVDVGTDSPRNLGRLQYPAGRLDAVLLTHFHSDHIDGLGELALLRWVQGNHEQPLPVIGPDGVGDIVDGFNLAYARDAAYRTAHHGDSVAPPAGRGMRAVAFQVPADGEAIAVYQRDGLTISAFSVDHEPVSPAVGYLFEYKGRSVLVSGDTAKSDNLARFAEGVDLLVHEALAPHLVNIMQEAAQSAGNAGMAKITADILDYHASPVEAAEIARDAGAGHLLFYHIVPPLPVPGLEAAWLSGVDAVFEPVTLGQDGTSLSLPAGTRAITVTRKGL